jgi:hypothetical protein
MLAGNSYAAFSDEWCPYGIIAYENCEIWMSISFF